MAVPKLTPGSAKAQKRAREIADYEAKNSKHLGTFKRFLLNANWPMIVYISVVHVLSVFGIYSALFSCRWHTIFFSWGLVYLSALGITAGVHRLWSHRSYQATLSYRCFMMVLNSLANQGTIHHWARDHRVHHLHCETEADPHNAERGFFFSHMGWLLVKKDPRVIHAGQDLDLSDLDALPEVRFQRALDPFWNLWWCFAAPALIAKVAWGESLWQGFLVAGVLRYVYCLHITWLVNSAAHAWGYRPYEKTNHHGAWPSENALVSLGAIGEGWHNWHHAYPYDYAASELGVSNQYNPTTIFIDAAAGLGLVSNRKRALRAWGARKERLAKQKTAEAEPTAAATTTTHHAVERRLGAVATARKIGGGARCNMHESLFGLPGFKYRRIVTTSSDSKKLAKMPS